ncbi:MAG: calcium-binding protein [Xanthobacteraceae bacterium]|nr:calcium-binding protein [Xanthobacteraceae bacterium]
MSTSFTVNLADLTKILEQIKIAERNAAGESLVDIIGQDAALLPQGLRTVDGGFNHLLPGQERAGAADTIFPRLLPPDFRTVNDSYQVVLVPASVPDAPPGGVVITNNNYDPTIVIPGGPPGSPPAPNSVADADPRIISNLIVDQTGKNPAAIYAWYTNEKSQAAYAAAHDGNPPPDGYVPTDAELAFILNASPDIGLSPGFNGWMTFFGQFFDHGLDLVTKGGNGTVYIPLMADDPLYDKGADGIVSADDGFGKDGVFGTVDDQPNFMALTRATTFVDPVTGLKTETQNTTTPFIDQNQTYTSISSHQVFLREYTMVDIPTDAVAGPVAVATGRLLDGANGAIATWAEVKAQAHDMLGLDLRDYDVLNVPLLVTDAYGKFIPGSHGFAQVVVGVTVVDSTTGALIATAAGNYTIEGKAGGLDLDHLNVADLQLPPGASLPLLPAGQEYRIATVGTDHAFLNDIAHHAEPVLVDADHNPATPKTQQVADSDVLDFNGDGVSNAADVTAGVAAGKVVDANNDGVTDVLDLADVNMDGAVDSADLISDDRNPLTYDNEMLDAHFLTGDGRGNENIGLTTVHTVFHSEHNRLVEANKDTIIASNDAAVVSEWLRPTGSATPAITQAQLDAINGLADAAAKAAAIDALDWNGERLFQAARFVTEMQYQHLVFEEFARTVQPNVDPFIFTNSADLDPAIVAEFAHVVYRFGHSMLSDTVDRLDNSLHAVNGDPQIGLIEAFLNPQEFTASGATAADAAGAIVRGMTRQTGNEIDEFVVDAVRSNLLGLPLDLPALNIARGRDTGVPTFNDTRAQFYAMTGDAQLKPYTSWLDFGQNMKNPISVINFIAAYGLHSTVVNATTLAGKRDAATELVTGVDVNDDSVVASDGIDFLNGTGAWNAENSGLNNVDLWIGGLAEAKMEFGGMLGSTFNFVFETQMENLQNGDRFYYLSRTQGMNLLNQLEPNTFTDLVMRNTDLGNLHATHLPGILFGTPDLTLELDTLVAQNNPGIGAADPTYTDPIFGDNLFHLGTKVVRSQGTLRVDGSNQPVLDGDGQQIFDGGVLKFFGGEHVVLGGTEGNDRLYGDRGIDTLWGDGGDDYLNAGSEADQVFGGDGDDIIEDPFGDGDFLRGNKGNDVIVDSHGFGDVLFGDSGKDFISGGNDVIEVFAGEGDDFVLGGAGADALLGNEGDDWIEGGEGFDSLSGENSDLFFNSPIIGHDVLDGQGNDTDYDGETGDDIMVQGPGIQRNNGMLGFDWSILRGDPNDGIIDLGISRFLNQQALTLRDRNDSVEGASGWKHNDTLIGTSAPTGAVGDPAGGIVGAPATDSMLLSQNVSLINGLEDFLKLTPGAIRGQTVGSDATPFTALAKDTTVFDPQNGGDILLGGGGSDLIFGKAGNDLIDGDRWLNVRIEVHANKDGTGPLVTTLSSVGTDGSVDSLSEIKADMLAGRINPGQLKIVREIITTGATAADNDVAMYAGSRADFSLTRNANGTVTVVDNVVAPLLGADGVRIPLLDDEGTDTLSNIEIVRFTNYDAAGIPDGTFTDVSIAAPTGAVLITGTQNVLTADRSALVDLNGLPNANGFSYQWQQSADGLGGWTNTGTNNQNFTVPAGNLNFFRVVVSYTDNGGMTESIVSQNTAKVGNNAGAGINDTFNGTAGDNLLNGRFGDDNLSGLAGNDVINGGAGNDTLNGGDGNDFIDGGTNNNTGRDTMTGGAGDDTYVIDDVTGATAADRDAVVEAVGGGTDTVTGAVSLDLANYANVENITLTGNGNNSATGNSGNNILTGNAGNNALNGVSGVDTAVFNGTALAATFALAGASVTVATTGGGTDTLQNIDTVRFGSTDYALVQGSTNADTLNGGPGADLILGFGGNDTINGGDGNDFLDGGTGNDTMTGGGGDDLYVIDDITGTAAQRDAVVELVGGGTDIVTGAVSLDLANYANVENITLTGTGNNSATGNTGNNVITGNSGNNTLTGGTGNDTIDGGAGGTDTAVFSGSAAGSTFSINAAGRLVVTGPDGTDALSAIDQLLFGANTFVLRQGTNGSDTINGSNAADIAIAGDGDDTISAGQGNDLVLAGVGNDTINWDITNGGVGDGRDIVNGGTEPAGGIGDTFIVDGNNQNEVYRVYSNTDDWDNNAGNGIVSSAAHAGLTGLGTGSEIVITRNTNGVGGAVTNANIIAELVDIEEIVINTRTGTNSVLAIGNFTPTNLNPNTITINDDGGSTTVDLTQLRSSHHVAFHTSGNNDTIIGARSQDQVIPDGGTNGGNNGGGNGGGGNGGGNGDVAGNGAFALSASDVATLKNLVNGLQGGEDNDAVGIRDLEGTGNNRAHPEFGSADQPFIRLTDAHYGAFDPTIGNNAINPLFAGLDPRAISNALGTQEAGLPTSASGANSLFTAFGQYFDHGLDFLGKGGNGTIAIGGAGTVHAPGTDNPDDLTRGSVDSIVDGVPQHLNKTSPFVDQNQAYGSNELVGQFLREGDGHGGFSGRLLAGGPDPSNPDFNLLPNLRELIQHHWANDTVFTDASLPGGSITFREYFAGLVDGNGVINETMLPTMTSDFMGSGFALLLDTNPFINLLDHYVAGDGRANENIALTSIHTIWARNHNFHVNGLIEAGFVGTSEELFQAAKLINETEYQRVVFTEFADHLLGGIKGDGEHGFDEYHPEVDARISHEFATAAYRFGHSLINQTMTVLDAQGHPTSVALFDAFLNPTNDTSAFPVDPSAFYTPKPGYEQLGINGILGGGVTQAAEEVDVNIVDAVRNDLVRISADVFAFDVAREWDVGIGSMNQIRGDLMASTDPYVHEAVGFAGDLTPYASWEDFQARNNLSDAVINQFRQAYPDLVLAAEDIAAFQAINPGIELGGANHDTVKGIDRVDLFVGGLAESHINGGVVGQTFWVILHEQLDRLQEGDRLYYLDRVENLDFYDIVEEQGFAAIVARNTGLTNLPEDIFGVSQLDDPPVIGDGDPPPVGDDDNDNDDDDGDNDNNNDNDDDDDDAAGCDGDHHPTGTGTDDGTPTAPVTAGVLRTGTPQADVLAGTAGDDNIVAMAGDDVVVADAGADAISGGDGADFINGGDGRDVIFAGAGDDQVFGGDKADVIYGDAGADRLFGDRGNDMITAGAGDDSVFGGVGNDLIVAEIGDGNDVYFGDDSDGGVGNDTLDISAATVDTFVNLGNGSFAKGSATSTQTGNDTLWGIENVNTGSGNDTIVASNAVNVMNGGAGHDTFKFQSAAAANGDTILGFEPGDRLDLSAIDADIGAAADQTFTLVTGASFTAAGQLAVSYESRADGDFTIVEGNIDSNTGADFKIEVSGHQTMTNANVTL